MKAKDKLYTVSGEALAQLFVENCPHRGRSVEMSFGSGGFYYCETAYHRRCKAAPGFILASECPEDCPRLRAVQEGCKCSGTACKHIRTHLRTWLKEHASPAEAQ